MLGSVDYVCRFAFKQPLIHSHTLLLLGNTKIPWLKFDQVNVHLI